ncbi:hypothetical protein OG698_28315 [Streptomyces sp. NBC_01003]|uniref:hypothetical protein n=1 Tax=Streptomyces sp. NBC_01003 TaxID=2903714 RepID=UPI003867DFAD|nr:hypothetical protein OG698_28315 [Streptomyces sp. NBC_01003]
MTETAPTATASLPARGRPWRVTAVVVGVLLVLAAGAGVWLLWPDEEPAVAVPGKVCEKSLPGAAVKDLMPEHGEKFQERNAYKFASAGHSQDAMRGWALGQCLLSGGGAKVDVEYRLLQGGDYTRADAERDARKSGHTPLMLGDAIGYLNGSGAHLFVNCPVRSGGDELLSVTVGVGGSGTDMKDGAVRASAAALAADTARHAAQDIRQCADAENLPEAAPDVG